jgi:hypothetical protein
MSRAVSRRVGQLVESFAGSLRQTRGGHGHAHVWDPKEEAIKREFWERRGGLKGLRGAGKRERRSGFGDFVRTLS